MSESTTIIMSTAPPSTKIVSTISIGPRGPRGYPGPPGASMEALEPSGNLLTDKNTLQTLINNGVPLNLTGDWEIGLPLTINGIDDIICQGTGNATAHLFNNTSDLFTVTGTCYRNKFRDITLRCGVDGGHIFNANASTTVVVGWEWHGVEFEQLSLTNRIWYQEGPTANFISNLVERFSFNVAEDNSNIPWFVVSDVGGANGNTFRDGTCNVPGAYSIYLEETSSGTYTYDNRFEDLIFEIPNNGCIQVVSCQNAIFDNCQVWDLTEPAAADLFLVRKSSSGSIPFYVSFKNCGRRGGTLAEGIADIAVKRVGQVLIEQTDSATLNNFTVNPRDDEDNESTIILIGVAQNSGVTWIGGPPARLLVIGLSDGELGGAWKAYTPTVGGTGWALGNGVIHGYYRRVGKTVDWRIDIQFGTTSTFGASDELTLTLPVEAKEAYANVKVLGTITDAGTGSYICVTRPISTTAFAVDVIGTGGIVNPVTSTTPMVWSGANGDGLFMQGLFEAA